MATPRRALAIVLGLVAAAFAMLLLLGGGSFYFFLKHDVTPTAADRAVLITASDVISLGAGLSLPPDGETLVKRVARSGATELAYEYEDDARLVTSQVVIEETESGAEDELTAQGLAFALLPALLSEDGDVVLTDCSGDVAPGADDMKCKVMSTDGLPFGLAFAVRVDARVLSGVIAGINLDGAVLARSVLPARVERLRAYRP